MGDFTKSTSISFTKALCAIITLIGIGAAIAIPFTLSSSDTAKIQNMHTDVVAYSSKVSQK